MNGQSDNQIEIVPIGIRHLYIGIALGKRALLTPGIKTGEKLHILEMLDRWVSAEILAMIDPMSDLEFQIYSEAKSLDIEGGNLSPAQKTQASYDILTSAKVFSHFMALNPGIAKAIHWRMAPPKSAPAPRTAAPDNSALPASGDTPERYHIHNVPSQTVGPASIHDAAAQLWPQRQQQQFANGTPNNNPIDPLTGRSGE